MSSFGGKENWGIREGPHIWPWREVMLSVPIIKALYTLCIVIKANTSVQYSLTVNSMQYCK